MSKQIMQTDIEQLIENEFGVNADYVLALFQQFKQHPASVGEEWLGYFNDLSNNGGVASSPTEETPALQIPRSSSVQTEPPRHWAKQSTESAIQELQPPTGAASSTQPSSSAQPSPVAESTQTQAAPVAQAPQSIATPQTVQAKPAQTTTPVGAEPLERLPIRGPALRIAENMQASLEVPTATSYREIPVKLLDENRRLINQFLKP